MLLVASYESWGTCCGRRLGWLDENGDPQRQDIALSYAQLIKDAGVSRGAIGDAISQCIELGFLTQSQKPQSSQAGTTSKTAVYSLRWSQQTNFISTLESFDGFFCGEGYRTPVPNRFFDFLVPRESLSVIKVVGTVIRHTIGYQNQFGGRRSSAPLSYSQIQRATESVTVPRSPMRFATPSKLDTFGDLTLVCLMLINRCNVRPPTPFVG